jgi:SPP1 gp7 family putative phage head morphogenesis protein
MYKNPAAFASTISGALTHDIAMSARARRREQQHFARVRNAYLQYAVQLRKIARHVGDIIKQFTPGDPAIVPALVNMLTNYAHILDPWAKAAAANMIAEVSRRDEQAWYKHSRLLGRELRKEIWGTPLGDLYRSLIDEQVGYIKSIPLDAAERVQKLTLEYTITGQRYGSIIDQIRDSTGVSISKATLIARTETAKSHALITQARAEYVGSTHYIWHTVQDYRVRKRHKELNGKTFRWKDPPIASEIGQKEMRYNPGGGPNCRCWAEPIIADIIT